MSHRLKEFVMRKLNEIRKEIKALQEELVAVRETYSAKIYALEQEAQTIRTAKGIKLKEKIYDDYFEAGRCASPTNGWN